MKKVSKDDGVEIEQKLATRNEVSLRLDALSTEIAQVTSQLRERKSLAGAVLRELEEFKHEKGCHQNARCADLGNAAAHRISFANNFSESKLSDQDKEKFESLEKRNIDLHTEIVTLNGTLDKLKGEEADLIARLLDPSMAVEETLFFQSKLREAEGKVDGLREQIMLQAQVINTANSGLPTVIELQTKREDMLAEIAVGSATAKDLENLDSQIADQTGSFGSIKSTIEGAEQTIAGLRRKLAQAEDELNVLSLRVEWTP